MAVVRSLTVAVAIVMLTVAPANAQADSDAIQILQTTEEQGVVTIEIALPQEFDSQLTQSNFAVAENGTVQDVQVLVPNPAINVVLVIDVSGSMAGGALQAAKTAAVRFVDALPDQAKVAVVAFGEAATVSSPLQTDRGQTKQALDGLQIAGNETVLWDGLNLAANVLAESPSERPYVIVLADGEDTVSNASRDDAVRNLIQVDAGLYAIALQSADADHAALEQIVDLAGGSFAPADSDQDRLAAVYADTAARLNNRYLIRYPSVPGMQRQVEVAVQLGSVVATTSLTFKGSVVASPDSTTDQSSSADQQALVVADPLVAVTVPEPGLLASSYTLVVGVVAMFAAIMMATLLIARPASKLALSTSGSADRVANLRSQVSGTIEGILANREQAGRLEKMLDLAGINLRAGEFVAIVISLMVVLGLLLTALSGPIIGLSVGLGTGVAAVAYLNSLTARRRHKFAEQLTEALSVLSSSLKAGRSLPQAIEFVALETPRPMSDEFRRIVFESRVGRDLTEAMLSVADRMDSADLTWIAHAVDINRVTGGNLTEVIDNVSETISDRQRIFRQMRSLSGEGRATAWVLMLMPPILALILAWRTPENMNLFLSDPRGRIALAAAVVGMIAGMAWVRKLVNMKY